MNEQVHKHTHLKVRDCRSKADEDASCSQNECCKSAVAQANKQMNKTINQSANDKTNEDECL